MRGTRLQSLKKPGVSAVHPRACGEHSNNRGKSSPPVGSSPRMRGTRPKHLSSSSGIRFIPAHAGNTVECSKIAALIAVHPRACGEHCFGSSLPFRVFGSSPRMRGTPQPAHRWTGTRRFIPAHAGNTSYFYLTFNCSTVHPRACGEHSAKRWVNCPASGSSPRMRGTRKCYLTR